MIRAPENGRIAHDIVQLMLGHNILPFNAQGIGFVDVGIGFERQKVDLHMHDILGLLEHLAFCNPQRGFGDGNGEIVYLNAVKLPDGHLNGVVPRYRRIQM